MGRSSRAVSGESSPLTVEHRRCFAGSAEVRRRNECAGDDLSESAEPGKVCGHQQRQHVPGVRAISRWPICGTMRWWILRRRRTHAGWARSRLRDSLGRSGSCRRTTDGSWGAGNPARSRLSGGFLVQPIPGYYISVIGERRALVRTEKLAYSERRSGQHVKS